MSARRFNKDILSLVPPSSAEPIGLVLQYMVEDGGINQERACSLFGPLNLGGSLKILNTTQQIEFHREPEVDNLVELLIGSATAHYSVIGTSANLERVYRVLLSWGWTESRIKTKSDKNGLSSVEGKTLLDFSKLHKPLLTEKISDLEKVGMQKGDLAYCEIFHLLNLFKNQGGHYQIAIWKHDFQFCIFLSYERVNLTEEHTMLKEGYCNSRWGKRFYLVNHGIFDPSTVFVPSRFSQPYACPEGKEFAAKVRAEHVMERIRKTFESSDEDDFSSPSNNRRSCQ